MEGAQALYLIQRYQRDPVAWGKEVLGVRFTRQQQEAIAQFVDNLKPQGGTGKMLIKSGYGTGKTWLSAFLGLWYVCVFPDAIVLFMSSSGSHVKEKVFAEFRRMYLRSRVKLGGELLQGSLRFREKWNAVATSPANPDNFQGSHETNLLIVFDEAQAIPPEFWDAGEGMMQGDNAAWIGIFNPLYTDGMAAENWKKPNEWARRTFSSLEHENVITGRSVFGGAVTREWVDARRKQWGEKSALYRTRVLGEFPLTSENTILTIYDLENAYRSWTKQKAFTFRNKEGAWLGVDIARFGSDQSFATLVVDRRVVLQRSWMFCDTMETVGKIHELVREFKVPWDHVNIDSIGLGAGVVDRLIEQNKPVNDVNFAGKPVGDWSDFAPMSGMKFLNRRAELHWAVRSLIREEQACIPPRFSAAWADLVAVQYKHHSSGAIQIEAKDDFRKRMARSPDAGDSVIYAFARMLTPEIAWS